MTIPRMAIITALLALLTMNSSHSAPISTTVDGNFQAIAQSAASINLYFRSSNGPAEITINDKPLGIYQSDSSSTFTRITVNNLESNKTYTFCLNGKSTVRERTWARLPSSADFDVLVIGGNAGGCAAAVTAAGMGLRVALVEETNRIGGMSSNGLGYTDIRHASSCNGLFEEFRKAIIGFRGGDGLHYESRISNAIAKSMVYTHTGITTYMKCAAIEPILKGRHVMGAIIKNLLDNSTGRITARVVVDDTDLGDFSAACGAKFRVGREARSEVEPHAGQIYFEDSTQSILPGSSGRGDHKIQSYAYLMLWKNYGNAPAPLIARPDNYNPDVYRNSPQWEDTWAYKYARIARDKYEINQHPHGTDWPGINFNYVKAGPGERARIDRLYKDRALGYLYYMQNEMGLKNLGLADDEFLDNDCFPVSIYLRETRRFLGEYLYREDDVRGLRRKSCPDSIAIGDYPMDSHAMEDLQDPARKDKGEGEMFLSSFTPVFSIPYGVIVPKTIDNLLITSCASSTHVARGALRMEPVRMSLGQAAGIAAALSIQQSRKLRDLNAADIQDHLLDAGGYLVLFDDVTPATSGFFAIQHLGALGVFRDKEFRPDEPLSYSEAMNAIGSIEELTGLSPVENNNTENAISTEDFIAAVDKRLGLDGQFPRQPYDHSPTLSRSEAAVILYDAYCLKTGRKAVF